jgi:hypothetical protein
VRRDAGGAEHVGGAPGAGGVDDRGGEDVLTVGEAHEERGRVAPDRADPVETQPGDRDHPGSVAHMWLDLRQVGEWLQVVAGELGAGGQLAVVGAHPAGVGEQPGRGGVDVEAPRGEEPDMTPMAYGRSRLIAGLENDEADPSFGQVRGGGETDRPGADNHDGQRRVDASGGRRPGHITLS